MDYGQKHTVELEIFEGNCPKKGHQVGSKFNYPEDRGQICPWLLDSAESMIRVLWFGGTLPWTYKGTPYQKGINTEGITTEFVRCPDPTLSGVVLKITATKKGFKTT